MGKFSKKHCKKSPFKSKDIEALKEQVVSLTEEINALKKPKKAVDPNKVGDVRTRHLGGPGGPGRLAKK